MQEQTVRYAGSICGSSTKQRRPSEGLRVCPDLGKRFSILRKRCKEKETCPCIATVKTSTYSSGQRICFSVLIRGLLYIRGVGENKSEKKFTSLHSTTTNRRCIESIHDGSSRQVDENDVRSDEE